MIGILPQLYEHFYKNRRAPSFMEAAGIFIFRIFFFSSTVGKILSSFAADCEKPYKAFNKSVAQNFGSFAFYGVVGSEMDFRGLGKLPNKSFSDDAPQAQEDENSEWVLLSNACCVTLSIKRTEKEWNGSER